jgi:septum site-determining protein MinC
MAFAITPQPPIVDWLSELDASLERSEGFFAGQHVALDLSAVNLSSSAIGQLVANLEERNSRVLGIEGVDPAKWQPGLPLYFAAAAPCEPPSRLSSSPPPSRLCGCSPDPAEAAASIAND